MDLCMRTEKILIMMMNTVRHAACNLSLQEDCDGHVPKAADRSLAKLFLRRGYRLTGGTCSTWETRFWDLAEDTPERMDTGDMSDLVDRRSLRFLDTAGKNTTLAVRCFIWKVCMCIFLQHQWHSDIYKENHPSLYHATIGRTGHTAFPSLPSASMTFFRQFRKPSQDVWSPYIY